MDEGDLNQQPHAATGYGQDMPQRADIDEILRRKRKAREYKVRMRYLIARVCGATGVEQAPTTCDTLPSVTLDDFKPIPDS